jgi:shikimate kinase
MGRGFYIIVRGPLGCGKSTISGKLSRELNAEYFAVDEILDEFDLVQDIEEGYISQKSFFKANGIIAKRARAFLEKGRVVIFEGNFYWKSAIDDLIARLNYAHAVFTLKASVETCVARDKGRKVVYGEDAVVAVYKKVASFEYGEIIDVENRSAAEIVKEIKKELEKNKFL